MDAGAVRFLPLGPTRVSSWLASDTADATPEQANLTLATQRHGLIEAEPAQAYSHLAQMQQQLEAAVGVSRSLLDTLAATTAALR